VLLISRNRVFLNGFFVEQEKISQSKGLSKIEEAIIKKAWDLCGGIPSNPPLTIEGQIHRVDILFRVNEASSSPLNFKFENITD
jgi:hypothetical protein